MYRYFPIVLLLLITGCSIRLTFNGASIPDNLKTVSVQYFENRAPLASPLLSQNFTEGLKDRLTSESRLILKDGTGDVDFSGEIIGYDVAPMAIKADAVAGENRLTVKVKVRYRNFKDPQKDWETTFSEYEDFTSEKSISEVEEELTGLIVEKLTQNVFNKAFADW